MKQGNITTKHTVHIEYGDVDYGNFTIRAKVTRDNVEYAVFYDGCNLVLRDKNGKIVHFDEDTEEYIGLVLEKYMGFDVD